MSETSSPVAAEDRHSQDRPGKRSLKERLLHLCRYWPLLCTYCTPLILMWLPIMIPGPAVQCAFVILLMIIYWLTECIPMAATGLIPAVLFPAFGILSSKVVAAFYMKDVMILMVGTMTVATLLENTGLHRRMAIKTLVIIGQDPAKILLGVMLTTWFSSMWIFNTAATIMMLPTIDAILEQLRHCMDAKEVIQTRKMLAIAVAYASSIGGVATITGTGTNLVLIAQLESTFHTSGGLNYGTWMIFALPLSFIMIIVSWFWLQIYFLGFSAVKNQMVELCNWVRSKCCFGSQPANEISMTDLNSISEMKSTRQGIRNVIHEEYKKLGPLRIEEYIASVYFFAVILLWIAREPSPDVNGWGSFFRAGYLSDTPATLAVAFLCYMTPSFKRQKGADDNSEKDDSIKFLVTWAEVERTMPWGITFLIGGGLVLSEACKVSGFNTLIVRYLSFMHALDPLIVLALIVVITATLTEFTSNMVMCSILMPMLAELSVEMHVNPLMIMFPTTLACSFAFMLPVATPPNAVVYSKGYLTVPEMAKCGIGMNIIAMAVTLLITTTYGSACLGMNVFPEWALRTSKTVGVINATLSTFPPSFFNSTVNITGAL